MAPGQKGVPSFAEKMRSDLAAKENGLLNRARSGELGQEGQVAYGNYQTAQADMDQAAGYGQVIDGVMARPENQNRVLSQRGYGYNPFQVAEAQRANLGRFQGYMGESISALAGLEDQKLELEAEIEKEKLKAQQTAIDEIDKTILNLQNGRKLAIEAGDSNLAAYYDRRLSEVTGTTVAARKADAEKQNFRRQIADLAKDILAEEKTLDSVIGWTRLGKLTPKGKSFNAKIDQLISQLSLENVEKLKGTGAISDYESRLLSQASSILGEKEGDVGMYIQELKKIAGISNDDESANNNFQFTTQGGNKYKIEVLAE